MNAENEILPDISGTQTPLLDALSVVSDPIQQRLQYRRHKRHLPIESPARFYSARFPLFGAEHSKRDHAASPVK